ncbi:MAG: 2-C-methyl-D-erythritol 4-phosphate cytidylyltransferase [bacterium]|nr:2-C-methyl-D-erythritol 4-phosphate cytidylyltransferase [bacterium]
MTKNYSVIIAAAGKGKRINSPIPKPYILIKKYPIIIQTLKHFDRIKEIERIIIVTHKDWVNYCNGLLKKYLPESKTDKKYYVIKGGKERQDSVNEGLKLVNTKFVFVHDAVRPFIDSSLILNLIKSSKKYDAVIPVIPSINTLKEIKSGFVCKHLSRDRIYEVQTPQLFRVDILKSAYKKAYLDKFYATDDSALVERLGIKVKAIEGIKNNIKITNPQDLLYAKVMLKAKSLVGLDVIDSLDSNRKTDNGMDSRFRGNDKQAKQKLKRKK